MNAHARGFTLLELLVALAVFAIMSIAAYSGLRNVLFTRAAVETQSQRLAAVQLAIFRMEQDIEQAIARPIRDEYGEPQAAMIGSELANDRLILSRAGWDNPLGQARASLQRVAYRLQEGRLWRLHWNVLDRGGLNEARETLLLEQVQALKVRFLGDADWRDDWPPLTPDSPGKERELLPRAIEIRLTLQDWGEITRLLPLPG